MPFVIRHFRKPAHRLLASSFLSVRKKKLGSLMAEFRENLYLKILLIFVDKF